MCAEWAASVPCYPMKVAREVYHNSGDQPKEVYHNSGDEMMTLRAVVCPEKAGAEAGWLGSEGGGGGGGSAGGSAGGMCACVCDYRQ